MPAEPFLPARDSKADLLTPSLTTRNDRFWDEETMEARSSAESLVGRPLEEEGIPRDLLEHLEEAG
jgi:hypothetical protein